jgi:hypothetical protein
MMVAYLFEELSLWNSEFHFRVKNFLLFEHIPGQLNPVHIFTLSDLRLHFPSDSFCWEFPPKLM